MSHVEYKKNIAYQGSEGANSHLVCTTNFPNATYKPYNDFESVFAAVEAGEVSLGIIPIENSHAGRVSEIHNILRETPLYIAGEFFQDIAHHLVALDGTKLDDITDVYSHPQALMQCSKSLQQIDNIQRHSYINTALAAKFIKEQNDSSKAALCTKLAAEINGLKVVKENMQDAQNNKTIFIAIAKKIDELPSKSEHKVSSLLFTVRNIPAAIYKALGGFATNGINIVKLESYIPGGISQEAEFYISFEGDTDTKSAQLALEELGFYSKKIKFLGVYDRASERNNAMKL